MSTSAGNFSSEYQDYGFQVRSRVRQIGGGMFTPRDLRKSRGTDFGPRAGTLDVSNRSADKRPFVIKRSGSKTRTFVESEEKTFDLKKLSIKRIKRPEQSNTEKKSRLTDDLTSLRTITTARGPYLPRGSFFKTEHSNVHTDSATITKKKSPPVHRIPVEVRPEKTTSLYERVQLKFHQSQAKERKKPNLDSAFDLERLVGTKASEASIFSDFAPVPKIPVRKKNLLKNFVFEKRRPTNKCHVSMALEDKIKFAASYHKEQTEFQMFLIQRTLLMLTKVRGKQLDNRIGRENPYTLGSDSPTVSRKEFQNRTSNSEDMPMELDSEQDEEDIVENDYKRFNYVINFKARPTHASAVFTNLDEAIEGHTQYCLTKTQPLYQFPIEYTASLFVNRLALDLNWIGNGMQNMKLDDMHPFSPTSITKDLEIDLIIRDKRAKKFQAIYIEENGKMNHDNFESVTLWGYQINKLLSRDLVKDFDELKVGCKIPVELRKLSTAIIKKLYVGLEEEMDIPHLLNSSGENLFIFREVVKGEYGTRHQAHLSNTQQIERMISKSEHKNQLFFLKRFNEAHKQQLKITWEKFLIVGDVSDYYTSIDDDQMLSRSPAPSSNKSRQSRNHFPFVVIHTIEDKSQMDLDSDNKNSGLPSPINMDEKTRSFKSRLE